jgi:uncharacterized membrane protein
MTNKRADDGTILLFLVGLVVVLALTVATVIDVSHLYLSRRAIVAAADAAALAGAQGINAPAVYAGRAVGTVPLTRSAVSREIRDYVRSGALPARFADFRVDRISTNGRWVQVAVSAQVRLPFFNAVTGSPRGVRVAAVARAHNTVQ